MMATFSLFTGIEMPPYQETRLSRSCLGFAWVCRNLTNTPIVILIGFVLFFGDDLAGFLKGLPVQALPRQIVEAQERDRKPQRRVQHERVTGSNLRIYVERLENLDAGAVEGS